MTYTFKYEYTACDTITFSFNCSGALTLNLLAPTTVGARINP